MRKIYLTLMMVGLGFLISYSQLTIDVGVTSIQSPAPNSSIPNNFNDTIQFVVQNFGTATIGSGDTIPHVIELDGIFPVQTDVVLSSDFPPGVQAIVSLVGVDLGALGLPNGNHTVCIRTEMPGDVDASNDETCATYTLVDPTVIDETGSDREDVKVYFVNDQLHFNVTHPEIEGSATVSVYSVLGQEIYSGPMGEQGRIMGSINIAGHPKGVYIVRMVSNGKLIGIQKLIKQ